MTNQTNIDEFAEFANMAFNADGPSAMQAGYAQIDFVLTGGAGNAGNARPVEFFSVQRSAAEIQDLTLATYTSAWEFATGDLVFTFAGGATDTSRLHCNNVPYRALFNTARVYPFLVSKFQWQYTDATQIQKQIQIRKNSAFGAYTVDTINPSSWKTPNQQQDNVIAADVNLRFEPTIGMQVAIVSNTNFTFSMWIAQATTIIR